MSRLQALVLVTALLVTAPARAWPPRTLPPANYVEITGEDHEPYLRMGPFRPAAVAEANQVHLDGAGSIRLATRGEGFATTGSVLLHPIELPIPSSSFQFGLQAQTGESSSVTLFVRARRDPLSEFGPWERVKPEGELTTTEPVGFLQIKMILMSPSGRATPWVHGVGISWGLDQPVARIEPGVIVNLPPPELIGRAAWGARSPRGSYDAHAPELLVVHHTYSPTASQYAGAATVRQIQSYHMDSRGWTDIGYHFLIGPDGKLYRGRPENVVGAHCPPNTGKLGLCVVGNFEPDGDSVTPEARETLVQTLAHLCGKYAIAPAGIYGHRDFRSTGCPGGSLYEALPSIREDVTTRLEFPAR